MAFVLFVPFSYFVPHPISPLALKSASFFAKFACFPGKGKVSKKPNRIQLI
jgi:hypothetical protein